MRAVKCVVVGDGAIGKTCLLVAYTTNVFPDEYIPTVFDNYAATLNVNGEQIELQLWDTAGQEDYKRLRPLNYPNTDVFIVAFSLVARTTLENVRNVWVREVQEHCPGVPVVLVGLKSDLRDIGERNPSDPLVQGAGGDVIMPREGQDAQKAVGAVAYVECSAKTQYNMHEVFMEAAKAALRGKGESSPAAKPSGAAASSEKADGPGCCTLL